MELTAVEEGIVMDNRDVFHKNGFHFTVDEHAPPRQQVKLTSVPFSKNKQFGVEGIRISGATLASCACASARCRSLSIVLCCDAVQMCTN
jgi:DNA mismatch repair ATPase MutL